MLLDKWYLVERLEKSASDSDKNAYTTFSGFAGRAYVKMNMQPASAELTALAGGILGKTYKAFTTASGVVEGMRVTASGTQDRYIVRGREVYDYGVNIHYELVTTKDTR